VFEGAINGQRFRTYIEQMLAPTLAPGDIVLLDNLRSHKVAGIAEVPRATVDWDTSQADDFRREVMVWTTAATGIECRRVGRSCDATFREPSRWRLLS
jgi:hypothetical protein